MSLYVYVENPELKQIIEEQLSKHRWTDSGFDIPMLFNVWNIEDHSRKNHGLKLGIKVAALENEETRPCLLLPRSSIGSTPFRITNSVGLIDQGYRGEVQAKVDVDANTDYYSWDKGTRMFQLCQYNFLPWKSIHIVDQLPAPPDNRGEGGFGSTGR